MKLFSILFVFFISFYVNAQETKRVLFLGNSYTYVNDLPQLLVEVANSVGDVVIKNQNTPGGYSLEGHSTDVVSLNKIRQGTWDFVVLQDQSQRPSLQDEYVEEFVYPYAQRLNDTIVKYNNCAGTTLYMTWGRENGDASNCGAWPPVCTYEGMDDLLRERYLFMANDNEAITSPVGAVWRFLREYYPEIDLYSQDGSHPSLAGSYAGAITFYTTIFKKNPTLVSFNSTLSPSVTNIIKEAVRTVVYDNLSAWYIGLRDPNSSFNITNNGNLEYAFTNTSENSNDFLWLFGDDEFSTDENPIHTYDAEGDYEVSLNVNYLCSNSSISTQTISATLGLENFSSEANIKVFPNPTSGIINITTSKQIGGDFQIEIYSILGKKIELNNVVSEEFNKRINIESLANGIYFLKIIDNENQFGIVKFIKE